MKKSRPNRALAIALSAAMMSVFALVGAAPAAAEDARYAVTGVVNTSDGASGFTPLEGAQASISFTDPGSSGSYYATETLADGSFSFAPDQTLLPGDYTLDLALEGYADQTVSFTVVDAAVDLGTVTMILPPEVSITGTPVLGNVLTAAAEGWPADATLTYQWFWSGGQMGGPIDGATASTYTVDESVVGRWIGVIITGAMTGNSKVSASEILETLTTAPKKAPAAAPADLATYLQAKGSTPQPQTSTGLASGALDPATPHTANVSWTSPDSFVDVYVFSTPVFVGTFPVVNGVAQVTLSAVVLGQLAAGGHTLVVTGQTSGAVQSVALAIGLPATGVDPTVPLTIASLLVLLGAGFMVVRRRLSVRAQ